MREIKFRGKNIDTNEWVYGYGVIYIFLEDIAQIIHRQGINIMQHTNVDIKTVGQFTGLKDKNGKEIYEGDILLKEGNPEYTKKEYLNQKFTVIFNNSYASFECKAHTPMADNAVFMPHIYMCEVIGNIHENPELLK